ncbi:hypothetical protein NDU88_002894 [Pleurodeles waltl]|uniref:Integrase catalytic domain-containing protein n=1 Tax=Pleurodeles waltl TaxID=8319 RepID=A0AAV7TLY6_PLEWA|nr:hypothetical protein NDU88_002894 [Pleurodeles waltl]
MDSYSKYPVVKVVETMAFANVAQVLEKVFALVGLLDEIKTDNGPLVQGSEFEDLLERLEIRHHRKKWDRDAKVLELEEETQLGKVTYIEAS